MKRRKYLSVVAISGLAGCSQLTGGGSDGAEYGEEITEEDLVLSIDAFPDGWFRNDEFNDNFEAVYLSEDETLLVMLEVDWYETVEAAKQSFKNAKQGFRNPQEIDIGDDAFWDTQNEELAYCAVRHSNLTGGVVGMRRSSVQGATPDQTRAQSYAGELVTHWRSL